MQRIYHDGLQKIFRKGIDPTFLAFIINGRTDRVYAVEGVANA